MSFFRSLEGVDFYLEGGDRRDLELPPLPGRHYFESSCTRDCVHEHSFRTGPSYTELSVLRFASAAQCNKYSITLATLLAEFRRITLLDSMSTRHRLMSTEILYEHMLTFIETYGINLMSKDLLEVRDVVLRILDHDTRISERRVVKGSPEPIPLIDAQKLFASS